MNTHYQQESKPETETPGRTRRTQAAKEPRDDNNEELEDQKARDKENRDAVKLKRKAAKRIERTEQAKRRLADAKAAETRAEVAAAAAETTAAETAEAEAVNIIARTAARAKVAHRTPAARSHDGALDVVAQGASEYDVMPSLWAQNSLSLAAHVNPTTPNILLAVMVSMQNHTTNMARIRQTSLENQIARMKEKRATSAYHRDLLAAFNMHNSPAG